MTAPSYWQPIILPDVELAVCDLLRAALATYQPPTPTWVGNEFPTGKLADDLTYVIVRYDGGTTRDTDEQARVGVTISGPAGTKKPTGDLARWLRATIEATPADPSNPIAAAQCGGPIRVPGDRSERYLTATLTVTGQPFNP